MHRLYVANISRQTQVLCYRLDFDKEGQRKDTNRRFEPAKQQEVAPGRQGQLGGDFHMMQITEIVGQLAKYGMVGVVDVPRMPRGVHNIVYNIDKPVPAEVMRRVQDHNAGVLVQDGRERRKKAAVATNELVQQTVAHQFAEKGIDDTPADRTDVTIEQLEQSELGEKRIEEGYHVRPEPARAAAPKRGRHRKH